MAKQTVAVRFTGDAADLKRALADVDGQAKKVGDNAGASLSKVGVGFAAAGAAAVLGAKMAVGAASDLAETVSKVRTIFGDSADDIEDWGDTAATSIGQSKQQALDAAGTFGNLFTQLDIGADKAADMSVEMVELASDFASFHNADITEVLQAQQAAFRGEYDAVQRFVPTINAAAVEQKALEMGLAKTTGELTTQHKALATQALLVEGAGAAAGDFARTSDGLANQQRILSAQFEDMKAKIGGALVPAFQALTSVGMGALDLFDQLPDGMQSTIVQGAALVGGLLAIGGTVSFAVDHLRNMKANLGGLLPDMRNAEGGLTRFGGAMTALPLVGAVAGLALWANSLNNTTIDVDALVSATGDLTEANRTQLEGTISAADSMGKLDDVVRKVADSNVVAAERLVDVAEASGISGEKLAELRGIIEEKQAADVQGAIDQKTNADAIRDGAAAAQEQTGDLQALADQLRAMFDPLFAAQQAEQALKKAQDEASVAARDHGAASDEARIANDAAVQAAYRYEGSMLALKEAVDAGDVPLAEAKAALQRWVAQGKITQTQADQAAAAFDGLNAAANRIDGKQTHMYVTVHERQVAEGQFAALEREGRASGGPVRKGVPYTVGEEGEEVFVPGQDGTIIPHSPLRASGLTGSGAGRASGGGMVIYELHFHGPVASPREAERWVVDALNRAQTKGVR